MTGPILVIGGTGKIGRRVADRIDSGGFECRVGSRSSQTPFDWWDRGTWAGAVDGVDVAFVSYSPDPTQRGGVEAIRDFSRMAVASGVRRLVLVSGRGDEKALEYERAIQEAEGDWTFLRCSWFMQNFSEGDWLPSILAGTLALPIADVSEPFVDAEDIADAAFAVLSESGHAEQIYDITGPRLLTFAEVTDGIAHATGHAIRFESLSIDAYKAGLRAHHVPEPVIELLDYLFRETLDGHNAHLGDGVKQVLGREPRDFAEFASLAAAGGVWSPPQS